MNSTYQHASFGLRYLLANLGELQSRATLLEWTIKENPRVIVEKILAYNPKIVGFGVYIWNTSETLEVLSTLKKIAPEIVIVLGGPEISYETETQPHLKYCDYIIKGEADFLFRNFCADLLNLNIRPLSQIIQSEIPDIKSIQTPYDLYSDEDIKNRVLYVEVSRGCPYKCEYCLSSLDKSVRSFDLNHFLGEIKKLLNRGARTFKFVDRTFNLSPTTSCQILQFFLEHIELGLFLHFEMVPDRLPSEIRELIQQFPEGSLQFEVGIQTLNPIVAANVSRKNDLLKVEQNFSFLRTSTKVHTHADLIVGLPGENLASFSEGFDRLALMQPDEIQVGILKRLKGTPIARHEKTFKMIYSDYPPYQILSTDTMDYLTLQKMNRFAKFWDLYANSGNFKTFMTWFREQNQTASFFWSFFALTEFLSISFNETHSLSLLSLSEQAWLFLKSKSVPEDIAFEIIEKDYCYGVKRRDRPFFLKGNDYSDKNKTTRTLKNQRQLQHIQS
ncbi:MAG: DUF4080 domain-containing protein [Pseudobdellovibrio sp.]